MRVFLLLPLVMVLSFCQISTDHSSSDNTDYYQNLSKGTIDRFNKEEHQILSAVVANRIKDTSEIVLITDSTFSPEYNPPFFRDDSSKIPDELIQNYNTKRKKMYIGNVILKISQNYRYYDNELFKNTFQNPDSTWNTFHICYPKTKYLFSFSNIALDSSSTHALIGVSWAFDSLAGDFGFVYLKKVDDKWIVVSYKVIGMA